MKALRSYIAASLVGLAACLATVAQAQTLRDASYHNIGRISPNGVVRNSQQSIGFFDNDGTVRNRNNKAVGKVNLAIYNTAGTRMGYINADGTVRDGESRVLAKTEKNGKVTDASHNVIGYAAGVAYEWVACYFFFGFFN